ncbi:hypothetical protein IMG5_183680 [Ichthyophthirius multifiliis]|uniref:Transmembrane protein n=1 Tax=Ichthyophthirius multifiliis TaxID=5932 RepID=G0R379_ICHMU|nr:hypothetical protein IMG5_183680 [Ichthyophthirius multifiliis]EGR28077.1 hypothetical protein IMG5_183680 [Ichthyophthirius multifiliis]|eukprot:XP_004027422.1 hypothetical protein IMG5_183680 [Ichthyophthirius multifiliis]
MQQELVQQIEKVKSFPQQENIIQYIQLDENRISQQQIQKNNNKKIINSQNSLYLQTQLLFKPYFGKNYPFFWIKGKPYFTIGPHWFFFIFLFLFILMIGILICEIFLKENIILYIIQYIITIFLLIIYSLVSLKNPGIAFKTSLDQKIDENQFGFINILLYLYFYYKINYFKVFVLYVILILIQEHIIVMIVKFALGDMIIIVLGLVNVQDKIINQSLNYFQEADIFFFIVSFINCIFILV